MQALSRQHSVNAQEIDEVEDNELLQYQKTKSMPRIELDNSDEEETSHEESKGGERSPNKRMKESLEDVRFWLQSLKYNNFYGS